MRLRPATVVLGTACAIALVVVVGAFVLWRGRPHLGPGETTIAVAPEPSPSVVEPPRRRPAPVRPDKVVVAPLAATAPAPRQASGGAPGEVLLDEGSLMALLRGLEATDPPRTLRLAREGNARFPDSPEAPERAWMVAKSLANMQRFKEAHDEAEVMVKRYPGTSWSLDVQRHLLSNPLD